MKKDKKKMIDREQKIRDKSNQKIIDLWSKITNNGKLAYFLLVMVVIILLIITFLVLYFAEVI